MTSKIQRDILEGWDILVVDDDPSSRDIARMMLMHYGATVHIAVNGKEGLEKASIVAPQFILSDLSMPVMDGWEMIIELKTDRNTAHIPIIALTAHAMVGDREKAIAVGCHNYMTKPLSPITFIADLLGLLNDIPEFDLAI